MTAGIFISYRRDESRHAAGRLADDLSQAFGADAIFRDIEGIDPGVDFTQSLDRALKSCVVMLVLIGPRWLDMSDAQGRRRLDHPEDWIRQEIATALARDVRVVPVLLEGASIPDPDSLPPDLQPLTRRQALDMSDARWRGDLQRLVEALEKIPGLSRPVSVGGQRTGDIRDGDPGKAMVSSSGRKQLFIGVGLGVIGLLGVAMVIDETDDTPVSIPPSEPVRSTALAPGAQLPDIHGLWRTTTGEVYHFEQDGRQVRFTAEAGGQSMGQGRGEFDGSLLRLALTMRVQGVAMGTANCDLHPSPDWRGFSGMCMGPNGPFAAQMFR